MKEPKRIKLTDSPSNKKVNLIPLPSKDNYPDTMEDDTYTKQLSSNENNQQNNSKGISELESM